jgi:tetratricopeptide (TPR) repeat protein
MKSTLFLFFVLSHVGWSQTLAELEARAQAALETDPLSAIKLYNQVLEQRPEWGEGWLYLGAAHYAANQFKEAEQAFRKGLQFSPKMGTGWAFLGMSEYQQQKFTPALADIQKGQQIGLGTNHEFESAARQTAAQIMISESKFDEVIAELQPLTKYHDMSPSLITEVGLTALAIPKTPQQLSEHEAKLVALAGQAQWNSTSLHPEQAQAGFEQLVNEYPNDRGVHYAYGIFLMERDQSAALQQFQKEASTHPDFWEAWLLIADLQTKAGAPDQALLSVGHARNNAPQTAQWLCAAEAGSAYLAQGNAGEAVSSFREAIRERPDSAQLHYYLSRALKRNKQPADAAREEAEFKRLTKEQDPLASSATLPQ